MNALLGDFQFFRVRGSPFMEGFNALESVSSRFDGVLLDGPIVPKGNQLSCHLQTHAVDLRLGQCDLGLCRDDSWILVDRLSQRLIECGV